MDSSIRNTSRFKNGFDTRVVLPVLLITLFCFGYMAMHSVNANQTSTIKDKSISKQTPYTSPKKLSSKTTKLSKISIPPISSVTVPDDASSVTNSLNTTNVQNSSNGSGSNTSSQAGLSNLQASKTTGDPNSFVITVPKVNNDVKSLSKQVVNIIP